MTAIEINGERIDRERIRREAALLRRGSGPAAGFEEELRLTEEAEQLVIDQVLLDQEALRLGLTVPEAAVREALAERMPRSDGVAGCRAGDATDLRAEIERRMRIDRLLQNWFTALRPPRREEVRHYYKRNAEAFRRPEVVRVFHIVRNVQEGQDTAEAEEAMARARELLMAGADFAEIARLYSDCPKQSGDLGYFPRGVMVEEFDAVIFSARVSELTNVFRTRFGFHIAWLRDRKTEGIRSFDEVRPEIELASLRKKQDGALGDRLAALRARAVIRRTSLAT